MTISNTTRAINILKQATDFGFEIKINDSFEDILIAAEQYLIDCGTDTEEEVELIKSGSSQSFSYSDGLGYEKTTTGEIIGSQSYREANYARIGDEPVRHVVDTIVNTKAEVVELYVNI